MVRDSNRQKLYDAESIVNDALVRAEQNDTRTFDFYGSTLILPDERKFGDIESVQRYVDCVLKLNWVQEAYKRAQYPVHVRARKDAGQAHYAPFLHEIAMPVHKGSHHSWAMREMVVLHEVAHHLDDQSEAAHGKSFAKIFQHLVSEIIGPEVGLLLLDAFTQNGVL